MNTQRITRTLLVSTAIVAMSGAAIAIAQPTGIGAATSAPPSQKRPVVNAQSIDFGSYDPHGDFSTDGNVSIEHLFLPWEDIDLATLDLADAYALERGRSLMITVEPWSWSVDWRVTSEQLLDNILAGRDDEKIAAVCSAAAELQSPVTIRWGQEMDETDGQFSWAQWAPQDFIAAYRKFVTECRRQLPDADFVWSPKGNDGLAAFYPGDEYVDIIGLSVFGYQDYDIANFGGERTFAEALEPGYQRVEGFGKPVIVAELGYEGDVAYVTRWASSVADANPAFPALTAVVYFNDREVYDWPNNFGRPDWRVGAPTTADASLAN
jgi:beta-mannanase